jgi:hypothetical protein
MLPRSNLLYRVSRRYVNKWHGENNCDPATNGEYHLLRQRLPTAKVVFDVGANIGEWSREALRVNPTLQLHCFEPSKATFELPGEMTLNVVGTEYTMNSLFRREGAVFPNAEPPRTERIRLESVDHYCAERGIQHIDLLKVDVEGYELEVFKGMSQCLKEGRIGAAQFEYGGTYIDARTLLKDLFDFVRATNSQYRFFKMYPTELLHVPAYEQSHENFQYANWVICKERAGT